MPKSDLIISGSIAIDRIMNFKGHYRELIDGSQLEVISVSVLVDSFNQARGGTGANIAYNLACLGERPILLGSAGRDAEIYIADLAEAGVDTSHVHTSDLATATFNVLTDSGGNQVGGFYPGAMGDASSLTFTNLRGREALFCVAAHDPAAMRQQVEECRQNGLRLMYDPGQQVSNLDGADLKAGVEAAEILFVNEYELNLLAKKTGYSEDSLRSLVPVLVSTHGERGSMVSGKNVPQPVQIMSSKPALIADPTGAGDSYRAGFLYGYLRQWEVEKCGRLGSVLASFVLENAGPQSDINLSAVKQRYQENYKQEIEL